jgi:cyclohexanecarboxyl-CoA dehydrogenase
VDLDFSKEQRAFREAIRTYARRNLAEGYVARAASPKFPWEQYRELAQLGVLGLGIPEEYGGQGDTDHISFGIAVEELSYADFNVGFIPFTSALMGRLIAKHATEAVRERWLPALTAGESVVSFALTEPHAGSDATKLKVKATPEPGGYRLRGEKTSVTMAPHASACIVFARTSGVPGDASGVTALLVDLNQEGVQRGTFHDMGMTPIGRGTLFFDDVFVPEDHLLAAEGGAFRVVMREFDFTRALLGLMVLAAAQASLDETVAYAKERDAFNQKLIKWEGVSFKLVEHATYIEAGRDLAYKTLWLRDNGRPHTAQAAMCKWWLPLLAERAIKDALLTHGHAGYSDEHPYQQRLRDVIGLQLGDGAAEIQKIVIARELFGRESVPY